MERKVIKYSSTFEKKTQKTCIQLTYKSHVLNASKELILYLTRNVFILDQLEMSYTGIKSGSDLKQFLVMNAIKEIIFLERFMWCLVKNFFNVFFFKI